MRLRQVLTIYNAERLLSDDETALLNTLRRMSDGDRQMFIDGLAGKSSSQKKSSKKSAGGRRQSRREVSLRQQIGSVVQGSGNNLDGGVSKMRCAMGNCGEYADSNVHHLTTDPGFHEFQPAEQSAATSGD